MAVKITDANYEEIAATDKLILIDFWAQWCGPCRMLSPTIDDLANEYEGKAVIGKVDVDDNPDIAEKFSIRNIPTILFVKNGEVVDKTVGAVPKNEIIDKIEANL
ncbi:MAG: thioredoxin [Paludibacteraceae bacterium]|nr:thioredoxin [Paludibacteraceae bacterium]MBO7636305.1 thioredoxin [Paludibacteraceae bacterium]MBR5973495.1 thioredoxin [Paludibacteraceae bacterium]